MDLNQLIRRINNPEAFQEAFAQFWIDIKASIGQSKTLAELTRFDIQAYVASTGFFGAGTFNELNSNLIQKIPPESEHMLISQILVYEGANAIPSSSDFVRGAQSAGVKAGRMTINNNGDNVLQSEPLTSFNDAMTTRDLGRLDLGQPIAWIGNSPLELTIKQSGAGAIPANTNLKTELKGLGYIS